MAPKSARSTTKPVKKPAKPKNPAERRGGKRAGAGRPKGAKNKRDWQKIQEKVAEGGMLPLEFMLKVMRNPKNSWAARQTAARDAAPYVHPRLSSIVHKGDLKEPVTTATMPEDVFRDLAKKVLSEV